MCSCLFLHGDDRKSKDTVRKVVSRQGRKQRAIGEEVARLPMSHEASKPMLVKKQSCRAAIDCKVRGIPMLLLL